MPYNNGYFYSLEVKPTNISIVVLQLFILSINFSGLNNLGREFSMTLECTNSCCLMLILQNNILLEFDAGQYDTFWKLWEDHVPRDIRTKDYTCQRLEFYIQIHFAVYPIRISTIGTVSNLWHFQLSLKLSKLRF